MSTEHKPHPVPLSKEQRLRELDSMIENLEHRLTDARREALHGERELERLKGIRHEVRTFGA